MGFLSPAMDYVERRLDLNDICSVRPGVFLFEQDGIIHVVDKSVTPARGVTLCFELYGKMGMGRLLGGAIITSNGEALEGGSLEDVVVLGGVTHMIMRFMRIPVPEGSYALLKARKTLFNSRLNLETKKPANAGFLIAQERWLLYVSFFVPLPSGRYPAETANLLI